MENVSGAASGGSTTPSTSTSQSSGQTSQSNQSQSKPQTSQGSSGQTSQSKPQQTNQGYQPSSMDAQKRAESDQPTLESVDSQSGQDEFEEVSLGATKGKVPKALAASIKEYQRGMQAKFQEVAQMRQMAQQNPAAFLQKMGMSVKDNPQLAKQLLSQLGADPYTLSETLLAEKLEEMSLSPEQKELKELREKNQKHEDQTKTQAERLKADKERVAEEKETETLRTQTIEAWRESGLPPHGQFGAQIAQVMLSSVHQAARELMQEGYSKEQAMHMAQEKALSPKDAALKVKKNFTSFSSEIFSGLPAQEIQAILGEQTMKKLRDYDVARVTGQATQAHESNPKRPPSGASGNQSKNKAMGEQEYRAWKEKHIASLKD